MTESRRPPITSPSNPRLRRLAGLRDRRGRDRTGLLLVDGAREVARALEGGVELVEVFLADPMPADLELAAAAGAVASRGIPSTAVTPEALARISYGDRASGIVAVARAPETSLDALAARLPGDDHPALVAVVEDVEKPGNLGAVCRSADGAGFDAVIAASGAAAGADPWNPNAIRSSVGTVFTVPIATAPSADVIAFLRRRGIAILAARVDGTVSYTEVDLRGPIALVLGSEAHGLTDAWDGGDVVGIRLPMLGRADSLNVAAAAAIVLYEARRQRG